MRYFLHLVALSVWGFSFSAHADFKPQSRNGECKVSWARQGFSAQAPSPKNTLFQVNGQETYKDFYRRLDRGNCYKEWLIVIYMAANNDLSPYSFRDIWEMEAAGSGPSVDVVVFHDSAKNDGIRYYHIAKNPKKIDYAGKLKAYVKKEKLEEFPADKQEERFLEDQGAELISSPVVEKVDGDSGTTKTAGAFMRWAIEHYPSRRLMLVGWSHAEGFSAATSEAALAEMAPAVPSAAEGKQGGFAFNFSTGTHMNVTDMAEGVGKLIRDYRKGYPVDIVGSDACLNQQVEFGYEWKGIAKYVFGSSTTVQKKGFNYRTLLNWFDEHPLKETVELAKAIPVLYGGSVGAGSGREYSSYHDDMATMASWNTEELLLMKNGLDDLGSFLFDWISAAKTPLERIQRQTELQTLIGKTTRLGGVSNDLFFFLLVLQDWAREKQQVEGEREFANQLKVIVAGALDALNRSVLEYYLGKGYQKGMMITSKGVAIWLPNSESEFKTMFPQFKQSAFYNEGEGEGNLSSWGRFIESLY